MLSRILISLLVALTIAAILVPWRQRAYPRDAAGESVAGTAALLFIVIFFATWAGGLWLRPFGPLAWGIYWMPYIAAGSVAALLLSVMVARPRPADTNPMETSKRSLAGGSLSVNVVSWVLILLLLLAIVVGQAGAL